MPERQQTIRRTIDWSYDLLRPDERALFRTISVFAGGWTLEAAEAVAGSQVDDVLDLLGRLVDHSLVTFTDAGGERRYRLLAPVREYALEQLVKEGEQDAARERHARWFRAAAGDIEERLYGAEQGAWLEWLHREHKNLRAVLEWSFQGQESCPSRVEEGLRIAGGLYRFWQGRGHLAEGQRWLERGLAAAEGVEPTVRARALSVLGWLVNQRGDAPRALEALSESIDLYRMGDDPEGLADALDCVGDIAWTEGDFRKAKASYEESLAIRRQLKQRRSIGLSLYSLGRLYLDSDDDRMAEQALEEALALLEALGDRRGIALSRHGLGRLALKREDMRQALDLIRSALALFHELGNQVDVAECLEALALVANGSHDPLRARRLLDAATELRATLGVPRREIDAKMLSIIPSGQESAATQGIESGQALDAVVAYALGQVGAT